MVDRQVDVAAVPLGRRADDVDRTAERILDDRLPAGRTGQRAVEPELEPGESVVVDAGVAEHLRGDRALRIRPPLLGREAEAYQPELLER